MLTDKTLLGKIYVGDNENVVFAVNSENYVDVSYIYLMNDNGDCKILLDDKNAEKKLNFNRNHQIYGTYRLRQGCEKTIYFTDNYNPPRYLNINDVDSFKEVFVDNSKNIFYGEVDSDKLRLQKTYNSIPKINANVDSSGVLMPGSYNFSVRYVDEDLNPTEWIYTTEPVMIYHDCTSPDYINTRVSGGNDVEYRKYESTNKSIRISVDNGGLDHSFIYVQFAMICANSGFGNINDVQYSPLIEMDFEKDENGIYKSIPLSYIFRGDDKTSTGTTDEIMANTMVFDKVKCLEQADNRLIMGNVTEMDIDWCKLQRYASKIDTEFITDTVSFNNMNDSHKDSKFAFNKGVGYQPGEIYSFGIVYVFENGVKSPVYHIPGKHSLNNEYNNQCENIKYTNVSSGCDGFDYWGVDCNGDKLAGEPVRHHRFPTRDFSNEINEVTETRTTLIHYNLIVGLTSRIKSRFKSHFDNIYIKYDLVKKKKIGNNGVLHNDNIEKDEYELNLDWNFLHSNRDNLPIYANNGLIEHGSNSDPFNRNASCKRKERIWKSAQYRFVDLVSYFKGDYNDVYFENLQEYPQFLGSVFTDNQQKGKVKWMTTSCLLRSQKLNESKDNDSDIIDLLENLDDDEFKNRVFVAKDNNNRIYPPVVQIGYDNNKQFFIGSPPDFPLPDLTENYISTALGFYVEKREESVGKIEKFRKQSLRYGIKFTNINIPNEKYLNGHKVIGYYIVQNERTEQDMTVLDSAILTPLYKEQNENSTKQIVSSRIFTGVFDKNCTLPSGNSYDSSKDDYVDKHLYRNGVGMICPRFKFQKKELYDFSFKHVGDFNLVNVDFSCNFDEGWITQDVQAGTSYNKKINKRKDRDNDGFDLHSFNQNSFVIFNPLQDSTDYEIDSKNIHYLRPSSDYEEFEENKNIKLFNASGDNSMCFILGFEDVSSLFCETSIPNYSSWSSVNSENNEVIVLNVVQGTNKIVKIPYGYLVRDMKDYYTDFQQRPYYAASDFVSVEQYDGTKCIDVYNGDCYVSPMKYSTGTLFDIRMKKRNKKATWWQYVVGALGVVGGTIASIYTGPAGAAIVGPSIALIQNGIRVDKAFQAQKKFIDSGGKKILTDNWIKNCVDIEQDDDEIQWVFESIDGLWFESIVNMNMRVGATLTNVTDYLDPIQGYNPSEMRMYYMNKLSWPDKDHNDGRMYLGYAQAEIYDINKDFERRNREKVFYTLGIEHECCSDCENKFPNRIVYSQKSFSEEKTDNYKVFLPANYTDIDGEAGSITEVSFNGSDAFLVLTEECLWQLQPSKQQQVNPQSNVVSFIGTGDYFDKPAIRIAHDAVNHTYGCRHQGSVLKTKYGTVWFSEHDNAVYMLMGGKEGIKSLFEEYGMSKWFEREGRIKLDDDFYAKYRYEYPMKDNTSSEIGTGYVLGYDYLYDRILITKKDSQVHVPYNCAYDAKERGLEAVKSYIASQDGWFNICYKWSQEMCCYVIDYETNDGGQDIEHREYYEYYDTALEIYRDRYEFNMMLNRCNVPQNEWPTYEDSGDWHVEVLDGNVIYTKGNYVMSYKKTFNDYSWTISFKPGLGFISFHSYMPNLYISTSNGVYSWVAGDDNVYRHNKKGDYLEFYGNEYPFVVELVDKDEKTLAYGNSLMESISIMTEAKRWSDDELLDERNIFFDYGYFYNRRQMTDFMRFVSKHDLDSRNYLNEYMDLGNGNIPVEKRDVYWHINDIRDNVSDFSAPMFVNDISHRMGFMNEHNMDGWIDKAINKNVMGNKHWWDIEPFKDTYICQRYFYDKPNIDKKYRNVRFGVLLNTTDKKLNLDNVIE